MARTDGLWERKTGGYLQTAKNVAGILIRGTSQYINFGSIFGSTGYGFRDNAGTLEYKNDGGSWSALGTSSLESTFETVSKNLKAYPNVLNYDGSGVLTSIVYTVGGDTITKTLNYTSGTLTSVVLSGAGLPSGLTILTKTLGYTSDQLTSVTYS